MDEHNTTHRETSSGGSAMGNSLPVSIIIAAVLISGSILYAVNRPTAVPAAPAGGNNNAQPPVQADLGKLLAIGERDVILGDPKAPVTIIEYSDFQCPFCGRFYTQTEPQIKEQYIKTNKAKLIYRHLAFLGPESVEAAEASECAKDQGKFWAFHDELFETEIADGAEHNGNLNRELFVKLAGQVGIDVAKFSACYDGNQHAQVVSAETQSGQQSGVNATPTSFVNDKMIQGAQPFEQFKAAIDQALAG